MSFCWRRLATEGSRRSSYTIRQKNETGRVWPGFLSAGSGAVTPFAGAAGSEIVGAVRVRLCISRQQRVRTERGYTMREASLGPA